MYFFWEAPAFVRTTKETSRRNITCRVKVFVCTLVFFMVPLSTIGHTRYCVTKLMDGKENIEIEIAGEQKTTTRVVCEILCGVLGV